MSSGQEHQGDQNKESRRSETKEASTLRLDDVGGFEQKDNMP